MLKEYLYINESKMMEQIYYLIEIVTYEINVFNLKYVLKRFTCNILLKLFQVFGVNCLLRKANLGCF